MEVGLQQVKEIQTSFDGRRQDIKPLQKRAAYISQELSDRAIELHRQVEAAREEYSKKKYMTMEEDGSPVVREEKRAAAKKHDYANHISNLLNRLNSFFKHLDAIFHFDLEEPNLEKVSNHVNQAEMSFKNLERMANYKEDVEKHFRPELDPLVELVKELGEEFVSIYDEIRFGAIENLVVPRKPVLDMLKKSQGPFAFAAKRGPLFNYASALKNILVSYTKGMEVKLGNVKYDHPEVKNILKAFQSFQKNLFSVLSKPDLRFSELVRKTGLSIDLEQYEKVLSEEFNRKNNFYDKSLNNFTVEAFDDQVSRIKDALIIDAAITYKKLLAEHGQVSFDQYVQAVDLKTQVKKRTLNKNAPGELSKILRTFRRDSDVRMSRALDRLMNNEDYHFDEELFDDIHNLRLRILEEMDEGYEFSWLDHTLPRAMSDFFAISKERVMNKIDNEFYNDFVYDKQNWSIQGALAQSFRDFDLGMFKKIMQTVHKLGLQKGIDPQELMRFTYLSSKLFKHQIVKYGEHKISRVALRNLRRFFGL